jgi:hypothetical protein
MPQAAAREGDCHQGRLFENKENVARDIRHPAYVPSLDENDAYAFSRFLLDPRHE